MLLIDTDLPTKNVRKMIGEMEQVDGVKYVLGLESVVGSRVPRKSCRIRCGDSEKRQMGTDAHQLGI